MVESLINIIQQDVPSKDKYARTPWRFWPSEASCLKEDGTLVGKCIRQLYYDWYKLPLSNPLPERVLLLGKIGNFVEYETRKNLLVKKVYSLEDNKKENRKFKVLLTDDIYLSGEVDIIAGNGVEHCGIEVKNYSNSTYQILNKPKDPHLLQAFLYAVYYTPKQPYFLIKYCPSMISKYATKDVYHRIDWAEIKDEVYPVINGGVYRDIKISGIIRRYKESKYYIKNKILPIRDYIRSSTQCKQCQFRDYCKTDKEGSKLE
jgi:CRISPR/Cas system-associated exonuclease Cas4 (RecB family)